MRTDEDLKEMLYESHKNLQKRLRRIELLVGGLGGLSLGLLYKLAMAAGIKLFFWQ
ncbi:hypothetical protein KBY27_09485 [Ruegeria pomeroyi]|uniref:Uncharacterized protein n=1 Tax=Ruegeria pomeroyi TaxID=89184 RepID=A0A9Q3ZM40_9RHOB|nr:hypothetical protein [Ruegeria pomeroyi]